MPRREFPAKAKVAAFQRAKGKCEKCSARLGPGNVHYDHVLADWLGGEPVLENCEALCPACHGAKTATQDVPAIARAKRLRAKHVGAASKSSRPLPGGRDDRLKHKIGGGWVPRHEA